MSSVSTQLQPQTRSYLDMVISDISAFTIQTRQLYLHLINNKCLNFISKPLPQALTVFVSLLQREVDWLLPFLWLRLLLPPYRKKKTRNVKKNLFMLSPRLISKYTCLIEDVIVQPSRTQDQFTVDLNFFNQYAISDAIILTQVVF